MSAHGSNSEKSNGNNNHRHGHGKHLVELEISGMGSSLSDHPRGMTVDALHVDEEYSKEQGLPPNQKLILTDKDALSTVEAFRLEHPDGITMAGDESELYRDELDELDFEQEKFGVHKGGKGRSKGDIAAHQRPDPSGNVRKVVNNLVNNQKNQRTNHVIQHGLTKDERAAIREAQEKELEEIGKKKRHEDPGKLTHAEQHMLEESIENEAH